MGTPTRLVLKRRERHATQPISESVSPLESRHTCHSRHLVFQRYIYLMTKKEGTKTMTTHKSGHMKSGSSQQELD